MSLTHGMNIEAIEKLANDLKTEASKVGEISGRVTKLMADAKTNWKGPDADKFDDEWNSTYKSRMKELQQKLDELGTKASNNAKEQQSASNK